MSSVKSRDYNLTSQKKGSDSGAGGNKSLRVALMSLGGAPSVSGAVHEVATDPSGVIANRQKEKKDLQDLNDRFATYIEKIRFYEVENKKLKTENEGLKKALERLEEQMKNKYEEELGGVRKALDETTKSKAEVEVKVKGLEDDLKDYREKYEKEATEHQITKESLPKLEKALVERDATIEYMEKSLKALEEELARLKQEVANGRRDMTELRVQMDNEIVNRVDLESQLQTKEDEIQFLNNMWDEKLRILYEELSHEDMQAQFSSDLAMAIRDIRAEYEAINEAQRGADTDGWYKAKFNEMMSASQRAGNDLANAKDEVKTSRQKYAELQKELMKLRAELAALKERNSSLETELSEEEKRHKEDLEEKEAELEKMRIAAAQHIMELKDLMDAKLALDIEICTYRRLLQGEEARVQQSKLAAADAAANEATQQTAS